MGKDLAQRLDAVAGKERLPTLAEQIEAKEALYAKALPEGFEARVLIRDALSCVRAVPKLAQCEATSVLGGLMTAAQLGLRPQVLGQAYLLPFWSGKNKRYEAQLIIGYQGFTTLAYRSGLVKALRRFTVYDGDEFEVSYGTEPFIHHVPDRKGPRDTITDFYAVAWMADGQTIFHHMTDREMRRHRDRFAMTRTREGVIYGPWVEHYDAMGSKTTIRMLAKDLPRTPELLRLQLAAAADEKVRTNLDVDDLAAIEEAEAPEPAPDPEGGNGGTPEGPRADDA